LKALAVLAVLALSCLPLHAQTAYPDPQESPAPPETPEETAKAPEPETADPAPPDLEGTIGEIRVETRSIFDPDKPGEDKWVFRVADRLHRTTRPEVIRRQILLEPGDP
jgi:hypothetical protein